MTNKHLDNFILFAKKNFQLKSLVVWDMNFRCVFASQIYCDYIGTHDILGKQMVEVNDEFANFSTEFRSKYTDRALAQGGPVMGYHFYYNTSNMAYDLIRTVVYPLFDPDSNEIIAIATEADRVGNEIAYAKMIQLLTNQKELPSINKINLIHKITRRDRIIILLLIIGCSHKQVAEILSSIFNKDIAVNTVSTMISKQIYRKLEVNSIQSLIQKAIRLGFLHNIPHELVNRIPKIFYVTDIMSVSMIERP